MKGTALVLIALTILGVFASAAVTLGGLYNTQRVNEALPAVSLSSKCVKPSNGFLVILSEYGYNDSILEGAGPTKPWPVITVPQGTTVNIVVCNADKAEAHGFQIRHYYDSKIVAVVPGEVLDVSFVANEVGTFQIYCNIFCTIHLFMQYGQVRVTA